MIDQLLHNLVLAQELPVEQAGELAEALEVSTSSAGANLGYLIAAVLFIMGIKGMTHPRTAVRGNMLGALGMFIAVLVTLVSRDVSWSLIIVSGDAALIGAVLF